MSKSSAILSLWLGVLLLAGSGQSVWADQRDVALLGLVDHLNDQVQPIEDHGLAMRPFYLNLIELITEQPRTLIRICHFGESLIEKDLVSGPTRRLLQNRFGDGGHGFVRLSWTKPWYNHQDVWMKLSLEWINQETWQSVNPGLSNSFGLGGPVSSSFKKGAEARYGTVKSEPGNRISRLELLTMQTPEGGDISVVADDEPALTFKTAAEEPGCAWAEVRVPDGAHKFTIMAQDKNVRLFGVIMENDGPGVVYDALGVNGLNVDTLLQIDRTALVDQLRHRRPALVILSFGVDESQMKNLEPEDYQYRVGQVIRLFQDALPKSSIMLMGPLDQAKKRGRKLIPTPNIDKIDQAQRLAAAETGAAFWSAYKAMGGKGSMVDWAKAKPRLADIDLIHPSAQGSELLGDMLYRALVRGLVDFLIEAGLPPITEASPIDDPLVKLEPLKN